MLRYRFVAIICGSHAVMLLRYITKATVGGLLCQLLNMIVQMLLLLLVGLLLDSCGCVARCGCVDAILLLITVGCLVGFLLLVCYMWLLRYSVVATY